MALLDRFDGLMSFTKATVDIARGGGDPATIVMELRERLQTLREDMLTMREEVTALREEKRELEERLAEAADFQLQRDMYTLVTLETGSVVYVPNEPGGGENQQRIYFCAHCFEQRTRTILQVQKTDFNRDIYYCPTCGTTALIPNNRQMTCATVPVNHRFRGF